MASHERLPKDRLVGLACAFFVLILCAGAEIFAQQRGANRPSGKLYLVAATLAMMGQPSGYPVTVYEVANGTLKTVREVIPPYPDYDAAESTGAPTAIGRVLASENALYFIHQSPDGSSPNSISIIHFDNPAKADSVQIETRAVFPVIGIMDTNTALTVVSRSASEDEVLIPILVVQPQQDPVQATVSLTSVLVTPQQTKVMPDANAWDHYALQFSGEIGGPNLQLTLPWGMASGNDLVVALAGVPSYHGHTLVLDELPLALRGTQAKPWILAANRQYLVSASLKTDPSTNLMSLEQVFVHDRVRDQWKTLQPDASWTFRLFGSWLASLDESTAPPEQAEHPGRENERAEDDDRLPDVRGRYGAEDQQVLDPLKSFGKSPLIYSRPGVLTLYNLADGRKIRIVAGQEDSEIVDVTGDTVLYRVNNAIYTAQIVGDKLAPAKLLCKGDDVPEVHWAFWSK